MLQTDYAGVDLLQAEDERVFVIEVNGIPGWRGLQQTTAIDIAAEIVAHALRIAGRGGAAGSGG